jgi:hypothetical protein
MALYKIGDHHVMSLHSQSHDLSSMIADWAGFDFDDSALTGVAYFRLQE